MLSNLQVGPQVVADGSNPVGRSSKDACVVTQDGHGRYVETAYRGNVYLTGLTSAFQFGATLTTTTALGIILSNPIGNTKDLAILQVEVVPAASPAVGILGLCVSQVSATAVVHTTSSTTFTNALGTVATPTAKIDTGATLPASAGVIPVKMLYNIYSTTTTGITPTPAAVYDIGGSIVLTPGSAVAILGSAAISAVASITWEEIPV